MLDNRSNRRRAGSALALPGVAAAALALAAGIAGASATGCSSSVAAGADAGVATLAGLSDLRSDDNSAPTSPLGPFDLAADPHGPPYPIVLIHGMAGFRNIGAIEYYYGIPEALRGDGHDVWVSMQDPINDSEARGPQVVAFVKTVLATTKKNKVNLIGHSQGGFDARFVASQLGTAQIASVVTIASPMLGDPLADLALSTGPGAKLALAFLLDLYGVPFGLPANAQAQISMLTAAGSAAFFQRHPDDPLVPYYSIAGRSNLSDGGTDCDAPDKPLFVSRWDGERDPTNLLFAAAIPILEGLSPKPVHDGLVPVRSARHGLFLGCIPADHTDEVHQLFGAPPGGNNHFDAVQFYRDLAHWLRNRGF